LNNLLEKIMKIWYFWKYSSRWI